MLVALLVLLAIAGAQVASMVFVAVLGGSAAQATPFTLTRYWIYYSDVEQVQTATWIGIAAGIAAILSPALFFLAPRQPSNSLHGSARWANGSDVNKAGLLGDQGIIVGALKGKFLQHQGNGRVSPHVFLAAPTGSGKTQGVMLPNALSWPGSVVLLDIKGELFNASAGYRHAAGHEVVRLDFSPADLHGAQYNPFAYVDLSPARIAGDVRRIADYLIVQSKGDTIWSDNARPIFVACALYFYGIGEMPTLPKIAQLIDTPEGFIPWCRKFCADEANIAKHHDRCVSGFAQVANGPENTVGGFISSVQQALVPLTNDISSAVLSGNTFDLRSLCERRIAIYVTAQPQSKEQYGPLIRLFFQQAVDLNMRREISQQSAKATPTLIGMDEFGALGKLPAIANAVPLVRSYGLRLLVIVQSPQQLVTIYGKEEAKTFTDNFGCSVFYTPGARDIETAEELSRLLGNTTRKIRSENRRKYEIFHQNATLTSSEQRRPLMLAQEILTMANDQAIIRVSGAPPIMAGKILAATHPTFKTRFKEPPRVPVLQLSTTWRTPSPRSQNDETTEDIGSVVDGDDEDDAATAQFKRPSNIALDNVDTAQQVEFDFSFPEPESIHDTEADAETVNLDRLSQVLNTLENKVQPRMAA
jgi:type IV secretion system protein VirD4